MIKIIKVKPQPILEGNWWTLDGGMWMGKETRVHPVPGHTLWNRLIENVKSDSQARECWETMSEAYMEYRPYDNTWIWVMEYKKVGKQNG